jgi:hypothetical protein
MSCVMKQCGGYPQEWQLDRGHLERTARKSYKSQLINSVRNLNNFSEFLKNCLEIFPGSFFSANGQRSTVNGIPLTLQNAKCRLSGWDDTIVALAQRPASAPPA